MESKTPRLMIFLGIIILACKVYGRMNGEQDSIAYDISGLHYIVACQVYGSSVIITKDSLVIRSRLLSIK
jgi:hypothetical protein